MKKFKEFLNEGPHTNRIKKLVRDYSEYDEADIKKGNMMVSGKIEYKGGTPEIVHIGIGFPKDARKSFTGEYKTMMTDDGYKVSEKTGTNFSILRADK